MASVLLLALQVQFLTTGGGRWRANPNLYDSGKVSCLLSASFRHSSSLTRTRSSAQNGCHLVSVVCVCVHRCV